MWSDFCKNSWRLKADNIFLQKSSIMFDTVLNIPLNIYNSWSHRLIQNPVKYLRWSLLPKKYLGQLEAVHYFRKMLHLRCLTRFWLRFWELYERRCKTMSGTGYVFLSDLFYFVLFFCNEETSIANHVNDIPSAVAVLFFEKQ